MTLTSTKQEKINLVHQNNTTMLQNKIVQCIQCLLKQTKTNKENKSILLACLISGFEQAGLFQGLYWPLSFKYIAIEEKKKNRSYTSLFSYNFFLPMDSEISQQRCSRPGYRLLAWRLRLQDFYQEKEQQITSRQFVYLLCKYK